MAKRRFGPYTVDVSNEGKVLFPDAHITKGDLIDYYEAVADTMLGYLENRPLVLHRFPDGVKGEGFVQQRVSDYFPDWLDTLTVDRAEAGKGRVQHPLCNNLVSLIYLANQATIAFHRWLARGDRPDCPDLLVFDLDPSTRDFSRVVDAANKVIELIQAVGGTPYAMTTGSRGLHVVMPLRRDDGFDEVRGVAQRMAKWLADRYPERLTTEHRKRNRGDRIYLDVARNAYGQTLVSPYSVRAKAGGPVAMPLRLEELDDPELRPDGFSMEEAPHRLKQRGDAWKGMHRHAVSLATVRKAL
ncbi:non-homologous end-joining DNA ligase [Marinobacter sp. M216]|uniref:Non-homologous end-joining DNA ligase n=1 Tax=Marinobacter albus TaxID=3030833 RepID=A0ABT7HD45_9GAMM|nr:MULTISPECIES: non-homologous end-joining DNA ligase [unclassified Marinobacter]MBW7470240.1 non-homologous end-joining DNA ligase [Marinobacter sp. F4218]MDK9557496.1 non-homologous end-joining DNA ligase [Marinobacter sp. M216]